MLLEVFRKLDCWLDEENHRRGAEGITPFSKTTIKVVGQAALIEAQVDLHLVATADVDAFTQADWIITQKLNELLGQFGRHWDPHSSEVWMPVETEYDVLLNTQQMEASLAQADYILLSKALKAPNKNRNLITEYLAKGASERFFALCKIYGVNLEKFV